MTDPMTADRPTVAEAVEAGARAMSSRPVPDKGSDQELASAVLAAVGYADLLGEVARLRAVNVAQGERVRATSLLHDDCHHDLTQRLAAALATVARVEALHGAEDPYCPDHDTPCPCEWVVCHACSEPYPCPTIAALHPEKGADRG